MQLLTSTVLLVSVILVHFNSNVFAVSLLDTVEYMEGAVDKILLFADGVDGNGNTAVTTRIGRTRFKRQERSKYVETAKFPQLKVLRIHLQMLKNMFYTNGKHVGGSHPIFHTVPKPAALLFKESVFDFFFPEIGVDAPIDRSRMV